MMLLGNFMTAQQAKELSLEVWRYLAEHPKKDKKNMPVELFKKIAEMKWHCPLCEYFYKKTARAFGQNFCDGCPLDHVDNEMCCKEYKLWAETADINIRQSAAQKIVDLIEAWEV